MHGVGWLVCLPKIINKQCADPERLLIIQSHLVPCIKAVGVAHKANKASSSKVFMVSCDVFAF